MVSEEVRNYIFLKVGRDRYVKILYDRISYIAARGDYCEVHLTNNMKKYVLHSTLSSIFEKLPKNIFFRCYTSYIVNLTKVVEIEDGLITLDEGGSKIKISQQYKSDLLKLIIIL